MLRYLILKSTPLRLFIAGVFKWSNCTRMCWRMLQQPVGSAQCQTLRWLNVKLSNSFWRERCKGEEEQEDGPCQHHWWRLCCGVQGSPKDTGTPAPRAVSYFAQLSRFLEEYFFTQSSKYPLVNQNPPSFAEPTVCYLNGFSLHFNGSETQSTEAN